MNPSYGAIGRLNLMWASRQRDSAKKDEKKLA
jgi:hypothetical protein